MKKVFKLIILIAVIFLIVGITVAIVKNKQNKITEYKPQEEISEDQSRQSMVSLYFLNKNTKKLEPEARLIDVKELINNPYEKLINLLIEGPKNENHEKTIPEGTKLLSAKLSGETVTLDFSEEFVANHKGGKEDEQGTIESIVNTLTELTEVNSIKILIAGQENQCFKDEQIMFDKNFIREE